MKKIIIIVLLALFFLSGCTSTEEVMTAQVKESNLTDTQKDTQNTSEEQGTTQSDTQTEIYVYVCGHVKKPGVYQFSADSRICDALESAGGVTKDGNAEALNQAEHMTDGQTLYVPGPEEEEAGKQAEEAAVAEDGRVNLNSAGKEELMTLPGIGEAKAATILQYREENGSFQSIEELMNIPGIKEGVFNKIKDSIKV